MYHKRPAQTSAQTNTPTMTHMQHWIHHGVFDVGAQTQIPPQLGQLTSGCGPWSATESAAWVDDPAWIFTGLGCGVPSRLGCGAALLGRRFSKGSRAGESFCWKTKWYQNDNKMPNKNEKNNKYHIRCDCHYMNEQFFWTIAKKVLVFILANN